jgi:hypothetical protein
VNRRHTPSVEPLPRRHPLASEKPRVTARVLVPFLWTAAVVALAAFGLYRLTR